MSQAQSSGNAADTEELGNDDREQPHTEYRNNAEKILKVRIDTQASTEELNNQIEKLIAIICPFLLRDGEDYPLQIKPLSGGLSNHLFLVSNSQASNDAKGSSTRTNTVMIRIHPDEDCKTCDKNEQEVEGSSIVDRDTETKFAVWLASQREDLPHNRNSNMAPTMYGRFENGRVEQFYRNVRTLAWAEMKTFAPWVAQSMASFHSLDSPPEDILPRPSTSECTTSATMYRTIRSWLDEANKAPMDDSTNNFLQKLSQEWDWLESILTKPPHKQPLDGSDSSIVDEALQFIRRVSITHMDCQPLNILINNDIVDNGDGTMQNLTLRLIDFEYAGWNPVAADIANTFCEYCEMSNLCADYEKEYPTPAQQDTFFWYYLLQSNPTRAKQFSSYSRRQEGKDIDDGDDCDVEWQLFSKTLQQEVGRFSLLSHLMWAIWGVTKSEEEEGVDFDYIAYAHHRMDGFAWAKEKFNITADNN